MTTVSHQRARVWAVLVVPTILYPFIINLSRLFPGFFEDARINSFSAPDVLLVLLLLLYIPVVLFFVSKVGGISPREVGFVWSWGRVSPQRCLLAIPAFLGGLIALLNVLALLGVRLALRPITPDMVDLSGFILPLHEEILFRGILCTVISRTRGWPTAAVISSLLFALIHPFYNYGFWSAAQFLVQLFGGAFFLAWVFRKTGTLIIPFLLHAGGNAFATLLVLNPSLWDNFVKFVTP